jgi:hypothetical protein
MSPNIRTAFIAGTAALLASGAHGAVVTSWSFSTSATNADVGIGEMNAVETSIRTVANSKKKNRNGAIPPNSRSLEVSNFGFGDSTSGDDGLNFAADTTGFEAISVNFLQRNGKRASAWAQFQYSVDGGLTFITTGLPNDGNYQVAAGKNFQLFRFDLNGIAGVDHDADFQFRVLAIHAPGTDRFVATSGRRYSATGATAHWCFDQVDVTGSAAPAPGAVALLMIAGTIATGARRRHP